MPVENVIVLAINQRRRVRVIRDGQERVICPYRIGWSNENNHNVLHYQIGGYSAGDSGRLGRAPTGGATPSIASPQQKSLMAILLGRP
jgi:hypothetical protein